MSRLRGIPIQVDRHTDPVHERGNALPILHEVRHALERLIATGEGTQIDLNAIPFGPGDVDRLTAILGTGEVSATIQALGPTLIQETAIPGVWLVDYHNSEGERLAYHIEIATTPRILGAQPEDLATSIDALDARLQSGSGDQRQAS
jgi:hydrogenase-1 operon protein HyaF